MTRPADSAVTRLEFWWRFYKGEPEAFHAHLLLSEGGRRRGDWIPGLAFDGCTFCTSGVEVLAEADVG